VPPQSPYDPSGQPGYPQPAQDLYGQPGSYGQPGYGVPPTGYGVPPTGYGYPGAVAPRPDPLAIVSMVAGIVSIPFAPCCSMLSIIAGVLGLVFGFIARHRIAGSGGASTGGGMALAGIIVGAVGVLLGILSIVAMAWLQAHGMGTF
jgi:hypothetical protein